MASGAKLPTGSRPGSQTGTRTLRWVLVGVAVLLVCVVAGFIAVGHFRLHNWLTGLPKHLGVDIEQETDNFTYSQSSKGKKIFTVHASKQVQHKGGKITLHDVGIVLYGPTGEPQDRIHGADFEYDKKAEVLTAQGEVYIDLVPPVEKDFVKAAADPEARIVHVKTIGLVFDQKGQMASSTGAVEFRTGGYTGNAVGATYDAKNNVVLLQSEVRVSGLRGVGSGKERPGVLTASRAEMDRKTNVTDLQNAKYVSTGDGGPESAAANHAVVRTTTEGTPQRIDAEGSVTLATERRGIVNARRLELELGPTGQAQAAHLSGAVKYANDEGGKRSRDAAEDARIAFDAVGRPVHSKMSGGVVFDEAGVGSTRHLDATTLELALGGGGKEPTVVRGAVAAAPGGARLLMVGETAGGRRSTEMKADTLTGRFVPGAKTTELTGLDGSGHSWVQRIALNAAGVQESKDTSTGETLRVDFRPGNQGRSELTRAEQRGGVVTLHEAVAQSGAKKGQAEVEHGRADDAVYDAATDTMQMNGAVEVQDATSALFADRVEADRGSGDAQAFGSVKVSYGSEPANGASANKTPEEPVHVLAARAVAHKATGLAEFFADAGGRVRMWQGTAQVEAPVIALYRNEKRMVAHGVEAGAVRTVLAGSDSGKKGQGGPVRIVSRQMVYTDSARTVEFTGGVRVVDQDGTMTSNEGTVWLTASGSQAAVTHSAGTGFMAGKVDHMVATGSVTIDQPGRRGTGEKLVYTASDGVFVLTGTKAAPPKVVDEAQGGMTTGAALRFKSGDDSVEVLGGDQKTAGRVRSETRMRQ